MSKYIVDTDKYYLHEFDGALIVMMHEGKPVSVYESKDNLEELNSDYINEHYGQLQDEAYKRGFEDGKASDDKGCEGCKYEPIKGGTCVMCCNNYNNQWTAKKQDDEIKVGDEVDWSGDKFIVTRIFQPYDKAEECDGVDMDGCTYHDVLISGLTKTGRHFDITDMLKWELE